MSTAGEELLRSFDLLTDPEKREIASEIIRRTFAFTAEADESELAALYSASTERDRHLAEQGIEDYDSGLLVEDSQ
jgi:hypothetical protein